MTVSNPPPSERAFGILQVFTLGTLLIAGAFVGALVSVPLRAATKATVSPLLDLALLAVECLLFAGLSWLLSRHGLATVFGAILGLVTRFAATLCIVLLMNRPLDGVLLLNGQYWPQHLLGIVIALLACWLAYRRVLEAGFGLAKPAAPAVPPPKAFAFNAPVAAPARPVVNKTATPVKPVPASSVRPTATPVVLTTPTVLGPDEDAAPPATHLQPPPNFVSTFPREDVTGTVSIPAQVILESVPEARSQLLPGSSIRVRLAQIVQQLPNATLWLRWDQVFENAGRGTPDGARPDLQFRDRWIRIPAKYYVPQVPREYFTAKKTPPPWVKLPEVAQEADIKFG